MGRLDVNSVDLKIDDNAKTHFTTNYTWQNDIKLVARRGFPINIRLKTTGRIFNPDVQVVKMFEYISCYTVDLKFLRFLFLNSLLMKNFYFVKKKKLKEFEFVHQKKFHWIRWNGKQI